MRNSHISSLIKQKRPTAVLIALSLCFFTSACTEQSTMKESTATNQESATEKKEISELSLKNDLNENQKTANMTIQGTLVFQEMEGGFMGFIANDGKKYTPMGIPKEHMRDGLVLEINGELKPNMITITQFGEVIKVNSVRVIDDSKATSTDKDINPQDL